MNNNPKLFSTQFIECKKLGYTNKTEPRPFKDYPELLPLPFHKVSKIIAKELEKDPDFGFDAILCGRFNNGECRGDNKECRKLRGYKD